MRRMVDSQVIIKSKVADDKFEVDLNEIIEKRATANSWGTKTITLQIYNKLAGDEEQNSISIGTSLGVVFVNGAITITKHSDGLVFIQGMLLDVNRLFTSYLEIESGSYENGIILQSPNEFDLYVIRV